VVPITSNNITAQFLQKQTLIYHNTIDYTNCIIFRLCSGKAVQNHEACCAWASKWLVKKV